jgi:hypothetical protein
MSQERSAKLTSCRRRRLRSLGKFAGRRSSSIAYCSLFSSFGGFARRAVGIPAAKGGKWSAVRNTGTHTSLRIRAVFWRTKCANFEATSHKLNLVNSSINGKPWSPDSRTQSTESGHCKHCLMLRQNSMLRSSSDLWTIPTFLKSRSADANSVALKRPRSSRRSGRRYRILLAVAIMAGMLGLHFGC